RFVALVVVPVKMCVDNELDRLGRELFDLLDQGAGSRRLGVGVDDEDDVVEQDDRGVAIDFVGGLGNGGVDSVCDRLDVEQVVCQAGGREKKEKNCDEHAVHGDISWQCRDAARAYHTVFAPTLWIHRGRVVGKSRLGVMSRLPVNL